VGTKWGLGDPCGRGRHVAFLYANSDAYPDLFVGNEVPRDVPDRCDDPASGLPNEESKLFINMKGTGFHYAPRFFRFGSGPGQRCAEVLDYDGDETTTCSPAASRASHRGYTATTREPASLR
jgi:hypothetical protein